MTSTVAAVAVAMPRFLNRERAILEFNRRVLAQAQREDVPLLERLRYVCIVSSNLDEFFEVRFADCLEAAKQPNSGTTSAEIEALAAAAHALVDEQYAVFNDEVMPALAESGIRILNHADRDEAERAWVGRFSCRSASTRRILFRRSPTSRSTSSPASPARTPSVGATR